ERRPRARELEDLDAIAVWIVEVDALAAVVRPADHGDRPGRPERDPPLAPLLVERVEAVGHEADVRAAGVLEAARASVAFGRGELEQLEGHTVALQVDDPDLGARTPVTRSTSPPASTVRSEIEKWWT